MLLGQYIGYVPFIRCNCMCGADSRADSTKRGSRGQRGEIKRPVSKTSGVNFLGLISVFFLHFLYRLVVIIGGN